jgi:glutathione peroxidase
MVNKVSGFFDIKLDGIDGDGDLLGGFQNQAVLVVNVASECGYTPQYEGLEALHQEMGSMGLIVLGVPCNQFGAQEPGSNEEILRFCTEKYSVSFPLAAKIDVNGPDRHPLYAWLTSEENNCPGDIEWNFEKFLVDAEGSLRARYPSATKPDDTGLMVDLAAVL